ncbi:hypothetical protein [Occallatibacter savannae]|uniref:hypothetical protein n=1 Tax=Occallatibacter savannae TaxID=1002691 RepID=UPI000D69890E|nr:hypothetical protein [Occallatibacter savannae]
MHASWPRIDFVDRLSFFALLLAAAILAVVLLRYPSDPRHERLGYIGLGLICASAMLSLLLGNKRPFAGEGKRIGAWIGFATGILWVIEISFNNFVDPQISTGRARFFVDNSFWAAIAFTMLIAALATSARNTTIVSGIRVGLWSGYISGIIACLMALSLILFGIRFLLRDPLNIAEYAARAPGASPAAMASYFAYETIAGALGHLFVLGIVMGLLLGLIGGVLGALFARIRSARPVTP